MARRRKSAGGDLFTDLAKKVQILEREMSAQQEAMRKLRELGSVRRTDGPETGRASLTSGRD
jgi:hypothetical protein